jgi:hypothetical protein
MRMRSAGLVSALIYTSISLVASGLFLAAAIIGGHDLVARVGGTAWVFLLSMIILMPVVTPLVKRKYAR